MGTPPTIKSLSTSKTYSDIMSAQTFKVQNLLKPIKLIRKLSFYTKSQLKKYEYEWNKWQKISNFHSLSYLELYRMNYKKYHADLFSFLAPI